MSISTPPVDEAHLKKVHEGEALVDEIASDRERMRAEARRTLGVAGEDGEEPPPLRQAARESGASLYPLGALGLLSIVDTLGANAFTVLTPEIARTLGISAGGIALLITFKFLAVALSPLPAARLVQNTPRRALVILVVSIGWAVVTLFTGFATGLLYLVVLKLIDGITNGMTVSLHQPLLMDVYPPNMRVRALSLYRAFDSLGNIIGPLAVALLAGRLGFTWRGVMVIFGIACVATVPFAMRLRDPGFGHWDTEKLRAEVHEGRAEDLDEEDVQLGFFEIFRRLLLVPTIKRVLVSTAVLGMLLIPLATFYSFYLDEELGLGPTGRGIYFAASSAAGILALVLAGSFGERLFSQGPGKLVTYAGYSLAGGVTLIAVGALLPWAPLTLATFILASMVIAALGPAMGIALYSVIPANMRPHVAALQGIFLGGIGGITGAVLLGGVQGRYGNAAALASLMVPGVLAGVLLARAGRTVQDDMDRMIDAVLEDEQLRTLTKAGKHLPMLTCRSLDYSYGPVQVLFDVDFTVDDGEMVALLGTNGAGKSTLLKAISGIGLPDRGTIRFRGQEITYLDAERRTRLGITQIPGGRAVFGPLTVTENLRSYGYSLGKERAKLNDLIDQSFEVFPRLHERRNSLAATLSGGEQQMLALAKSLILRPRLLIIDELSLGLAPVIVGELLDMVREINAQGTAVVLVEQSVNIALSLVDHAYFMEKGEMRFDGAAADLLGRDDLLRAVFLEGTGAKK